MTKRYADSTAHFSPIDPNHPWVDRGYKPEFAYTTRKAPVEDPFGEIAYQRALFEAAGERSRRVPDPHLYHNSPSAQEYMKRKEHAIFSASPPARSNNKRSSHQPNTPTSTTSSSYSPVELPSFHDPRNGFTSKRSNMKPGFEPLMSITNPSLDNRHVPQVSPRTLNPPATSHQSYTPHSLPWTMEPKLEPPGPGKIYR